MLFQWFLKLLIQIKYKDSFLKYFFKQAQRNPLGLLLYCEY